MSFCLFALKNRQEAEQHLTESSQQTDNWALCIHIYERKKMKWMSAKKFEIDLVKNGVGCLPRLYFKQKLFYQGRHHE